MTKNARRRQIITNLIMVIITILCLFPLVLMLSGSLTEETTLKSTGYTIIPGKLSLDAYKYIFTTSQTVFRSYGISILVTAVGTMANLTMTILFAYTLSRPGLPGKTILSFFMFFTMLFNGGLVSSYTVWTQIFHIRDTIWALIVPNLMLGAFYIIMVRSYFTNSVPEEIIEEARIDGANEFYILGRIVIPLSKPIIASVGLMVGISYWNDWTNGLYFLLKRTDFYGIQNLLNKMLMNADYLASQSNALSTLAAKTVPTVGVRMAIAVTALIPVLIIYPFVQRFLVSGIMVGGVKG